MKNLIIILLFTSIHSYGQQIPNGTCEDLSGYSVDVVFYPNTTTNYTIPPVTFQWFYLCGPNTILYDTAYPTGRVVLINTGCAYTKNGGGGGLSNFFYVKNSGTLTLPPNSNNNRVFFEPSAIIIDQTLPGATFTTLCTNLIFPTVNCIATRLNSNILDGSKFTIYPNPSAQYFNIKLNSKNSSTKYCIYNYLGELIKEDDINFDNDIATINTEQIANGVYTLRLLTSTKECSNYKIFITK